MLEFIRKIISSRVGTIVVIGLLVLIALAFAGSGVTSMMNGTSGGGTALVTVGGEKIEPDSVRLAANSALDTVKQSQPNMSMQAFLAQGGLDQVIDGVVDRTAMLAWGKTHAVVAGDRLIDSELVKIPAFLGPDGKFSQTQFNALIAQRGIGEALVRGDIAQTLVARELLLPAAFGASFPRALAIRYARLLKETRTGAIAVLPAALFAPQTPPDAGTLAAWYGANRARFIRPERRVVRYALLEEGALKAVAAPGEQEIAARYTADAAQYAALETRALTQLIVPDEGAAKAVVAKVAQGTSLAAAARTRGLATSTVAATTKAALVGQTGQAVADAAFAAARGTLAAPARGALGWYVVHVDGITTRPARTLAQAHDEIAAALTAQKRRKALADLSGQIEDEFDGGTSVADVAKTLGLAIAQTAPLTADGAVYGKPGEQSPAVLARVLKAAFAMEQENQPQIAETDPGKAFVLFDVARITPSAPAPLAEISNDVTAAYMLERGEAAAGEAARKVLAAAKAGAPLDKAMVAAGRPLPPPQAVTMNREQLAAIAQQSRQPPPPPLALLFSMAQGTTKLLPAQGRGWFVVSLRQVALAPLKPDDPVVASAQAQLAKLAGDEYGAALRRAIRDEVGVKRNDAAYTTLRGQLAGGAAGDAGDR